MNQFKMDWSSPKLVTYGDVEQITAEKRKRVGRDDGFLLEGDNGDVSIGC